MKKSLIALAVLGAVSGAASAQSSVTMYGIVDIGVQYNKRGVNIGTTAAPNIRRKATGASTAATSRAAAWASAARKLWAATGARSSTLRWASTSPPARRLAGLAQPVRPPGLWWLPQAKAGTFVLGRIATPSSGTGDFDLFGAVDPFGTGFGLIGLQATFIPSGSLREDNSVAWASPTWAGFKFGAQYSFNIDTGETAPSGTNTKAYNLGANWTWGPLFLAATYDVDSTVRRRPAGSLGERRQPRPEDAAGRRRLRLQVPEGACRVRRPEQHQRRQHDRRHQPARRSALHPGGHRQLQQPGLHGRPDGSAVRRQHVRLVPVVGCEEHHLADSAPSSSPTTTSGVSATRIRSRAGPTCMSAYGQRTWDGRITATPAGGGILPNASQIVDRKQFALGIRHLF